MGQKLKIYPDTINLLEEMVGKNLIDIDIDDFFNIMPKAQTTKAKLNKWDYFNQKLLYRKRKNKMKRQCTEWEKIFYKPYVR